MGILETTRLALRRSELPDVEATFGTIYSDQAHAPRHLYLGHALASVPLPGQEAFWYNEREGKDGNRFAEVLSNIGGKRLMNAGLTGV